MISTCTNYLDMVDYMYKPKWLVANPQEDKDEKECRNGLYRPPADYGGLGCIQSYCLQHHKENECSAEKGTSHSTDHSRQSQSNMVRRSLLTDNRKKGDRIMNETKTNISLELLLLNDLLRANAIDKDIYDKATQKIVSAKKEKQAA